MHIIGRLKHALITALFVLSGFTPLTAGSTAAAATNYHANRSVEASTNGSSPSNWASNRWGTNTATLTYEDNGHTGNKSLRVDMQSRTNGDAKWMADPVAVSAGTAYTYTSFYNKSNISTEIDLQYIDASGAYSYAYVTTVGAATNWTELSAQFTVPTGATKVVVMHVVASSGWLQTDDFSLTTTSDGGTTDPGTTDPGTTDPGTTDPTGKLLLNPSVEDASNGLPTGWTANKWGTNTADMSYYSGGHTGGKSLYINMSAHTSGDAKWMHNSVSVAPGTTYTYTSYYKSNVDTEIDLQYTSTTGAVSYAYVTAVPASNDWQLMTATFTTPSGVSKVVVMHVVTTRWLATDRRF